MAHFIGFVTGNARAAASRLGTKRNGINAEARGWDIGGVVEVHHDASLGADGADVVNLYVNCG